MSLLRLAATTACLLAVASFPLVRASADTARPAGQGQSTPARLPVGDPDLPESRTTQALAAGVTLTRILRGTDPAPPDQIGTTTRGPWSVDVLTIDPSRAHGTLRATFGHDLAGADRTTDLVRLSGALAGVNASFFTFTADPRFPGDPVGLGLYDGRLLSEPTTDPTEADVLVGGDRLRFGPLRWSGRMRNRLTGGTLPLEFLDHPPVVPAACAPLPDQTQCAEPGDTVLFTPEFGAATPPGPGVEVVLDGHGCVVRTADVRGTHLDRGQTAIQATGHDTVPLLAATGHGCLSRTLTLTGADGHRIPLRRGLYGVNGRYRLVADGKIVVPEGSGSFFARNPRTVVGATAGHRIELATIDGRSVHSVGTTLAETAAVARALGMRDAVNLDGGGSTTMSVAGTLVNHPSGSAERAVGDALVFVPR